MGKNTGVAWDKNTQMAWDKRQLGAKHTGRMGQNILYSSGSMGKIKRQYGTKCRGSMGQNIEVAWNIIQR